METIAFILSLFGTICVCIPPLLKGKNMKLILMLVFLSGAAVGFSYVLTGAMTGGVSCLIGAVQAIINYFFERKGKNPPVWLIVIYAISFTTANLVVFSGAVDILAIVACLVYIGSICQKNGAKYRIWIFINTALWVAYDIVSTSYGPLVTHGTLLAIIAFGIIAHDIIPHLRKAE